MKITESAEIESALSKFVPSPNGAQATCRLIPGASSAMDPQEWAEAGTLDERPAVVYYLFSAAEASSDDPDNYPWDAAHVDRIEVEEDSDC